MPSDQWSDGRPGRERRRHSGWRNGWGRGEITLAVLKVITGSTEAKVSSNSRVPPTKLPSFLQTHSGQSDRSEEMLFFCQHRERHVFVLACEELFADTVTVH